MSHAYVDVVALSPHRPSVTAPSPPLCNFLRNGLMSAASLPQSFTSYSKGEISRQVEADSAPPASFDLSVHPEPESPARLK